MSLPYRQIHLDFHTPQLPFELANKFNKEDFQQRLLDAAIQSVTLTGRCHHGHIYYETSLAAKHPQMNGDLLMAQIDACHEVGIRAPIYLTVGWDAFMAELHPEWLERTENGEMYGFNDYGQLSPGWKTLCFNSGYRDYLILQVQDTIQHVGGKLDGLFFDIMWQDPCCCNACMKKMHELGMNPADEAQRILFARKTEVDIKQVLKETVAELAPECPVFFNEGNITPSIRETLDCYGHLEIESLPSGEWGYQHFPTVVRYAKNLGKEYVGMTGKFHKIWADFGSYKNKAALEYECFLSLAHGGKCSIGDQMYPEGELQEDTYELIGSVYQQIAEREAWSKDSDAITEIAILHPGIVTVSEEKVDLSLAGAVNLLNEAQYQFDIIDDLMEMATYKLLILPDKIILTSQLEQKLRNYMEQGGKIIATYQSGLLSEKNEFSTLFGLTYQQENYYQPTYGVYQSVFSDKLPKAELVLHGPSLVVKVLDGEVIGEEARPLYQRDYTHYYSHFQAPVSEKTGNPVAIKQQQLYYFTHPLFEMYKEQGVKAYKEQILAAISDLLAEEKFVTGTFPSSADVILNHQKDEKRIVLHVLHYIPERRSTEIDTIEEAIPLHDIAVTLDWQGICQRTGLTNSEKIKSVKLAPSNEEITAELKDGQLHFTIEKVVGYGIVSIQYEGEEE